MKSDLLHQEIFQYLLGALSPERAEELELRILEDSDFHQEVNICERELADRYVQDDLAPAERSLVEQRFLASDMRRQQVLFAAALQKKISAVSHSRVQQPRYLLAGSFFRAGYKWSVAALLLLAMLLGLQDFRLGRQLRRAEEHLAAVNRQLENAASGPAVPAQGWGPQDAVIVASLSPTERGESSNSISVPMGVRAVQLRLSVPEDWQGEASVKLMNDRSETIAMNADVRSQRLGSGRFLIATFAVDHLADGNYFLRATAKDSPRHSDYAFKVNRQ